MRVGIDGSEKPHRFDGGAGVHRPRSTRLWSRFVWLMRGVLPGAALGLFTVLVAWPNLMVPDERVTIGESTLPSGLGGADALTMVNPRYYGVDVETRPYSVSADSANRGNNDSDTIMLEKPRADTVARDGSGILLDADRGVYRHAAEKIELYGNVNLYHDHGYEIHTEEARVDLSAGIAEGDKPIQGHGPSLQLEGEGFRLIEKEQLVVLTGKSRLVIYPQKKPSP